MTNFIDQFMWGYQQHFQISLQFSAENLLEKLDKSLKPQVFLLGLLDKKIENRHTVCLEPEDCGYYQENFKDIKNIASNLKKVDIDSKIIHSNDFAQENADIRLEYKSLKQSVLKILQMEDSFKEIVSFVSTPKKKEGYLIFIIIQVNKSAYDFHYKLQKKKFDRFPISQSFLDSVIKEYLFQAANELYKPNVSSITFNYDEIIKTAGKNFIATISCKGDNLIGVNHFYDTICDISALKYEGKECKAGLIIAKKEHPNIKFTIKLSENIRLDEYRKVRKLLEMCDENKSLISDSYEVFGIGHTFDNSELLPLILYFNYLQKLVRKQKSCIFAKKRLIKCNCNYQYFR